MMLYVLTSKIHKAAVIDKGVQHSQHKMIQINFAKKMRPFFGVNDLRVFWVWVV